MPENPPLPQPQETDPQPPNLALRAMLHLLGVVMIIPGLVFATGVLILGRAIAQDSLLGLIGSLLVDVLWIVPWGLLIGIVLIITLIGLGLSSRWRWVGAAGIALLALASTTVLFASGAWPHSIDELVFYLPGFAALGIGTWLVAVEAPRTPRKVRPEAATGT